MDTMDTKQVAMKRPLRVLDPSLRDSRVRIADANNVVIVEMGRGYEWLARRVVRVLNGRWWW